MDVIFCIATLNNIEHISASYDFCIDVFPTGKMQNSQTVEDLTNFIWFCNALLWVVERSFQATFSTVTVTVVITTTTKETTTGIPTTTMETTPLPTATKAETTTVEATTTSTEPMTTLRTTTPRKSK